MARVYILELIIDESIEGSVIYELVSSNYEEIEESKNEEDLCDISSVS